MNQHTITLLFIIVILVFVGGAVYYFGYGQNQQRETSVQQSTPSASSNEPATGSIQGEVSYPSSSIPQNMRICAEEVDAIQNTECHAFTDVQTDTTTFTFSLPVGTYYVYATLPESNFKAYYNEFVTCGLQVGCDSREKIPVTVQSGEITTEVRPQDWYGP